MRIRIQLTNKYAISLTQYAVDNGYYCFVPKINDIYNFGIDY